MKKKLLLFGVFAICLAILASGTIAYFTAEEKAENVITAGGIDIAIIEKTDAGDGTLVEFPKEGLTGILPGTVASKIVSVQNIGSGDAWIRVKVTTDIVSEDGTALPLTLEDGTPVMDIVMNTEDWTEKDGWYYYNASVASNAITDVLFEEVLFAHETGNDYQHATATIDVCAQAVQSANNADSSLNAVGWPTEVID